MVEVLVNLGARGYPVHIGLGAFVGFGEAFAARFRGRRPVVITDTTVGRLWGGALDTELAHVGGALGRFEMPAGEAHKTLDTWARAVDSLLAAGVDRHTPVIALGGGVVGDVAGFAAATVMRGLPVVQVPTTLLAMVDSSVGGKTAVNHSLGKNLVGVFHQPAWVWAGLGTLSTLPEAERVAGLGEVVKTALIEGGELWRRVQSDAERLAAGEVEALAPVVAACVEAKARVVAADEREAGVRAWLNLGHTLGHGLEAALGYGAIPHGAAVALGLVYEAAWAARAGLGCEPGLPATLSALLPRLGLPVAWPPAAPDAVLAAMRLDKKADRGTLSVPVCVRPGVMRIVEVAADRLPELLPESP